MDSIGIRDTSDYFEQLQENHFFDIENSTDRVYKLNPSLGTGQIERVELAEGVEVAFMEMYFHKDVIYEYQIDCKFFEFAYCLEGKMSYGDYQSKENIDINSGDVFYWINGLDKGWIKYHKNTKYSMVAIIYKDHFFDGLVEKSDEIKQIMFGNGLRAFTGFIDSSELILNFNQMSEYKEKPHSLHRYMYLYSKAFEMVAVFLKEKQAELVGKQSKIKLTDDDVKKIKEARQIVEGNIAEPYSIDELSRLVGLNTFKLKCGFKELYQNTVFGYLRECRMKKARRCLSCSNCTVLEVANIVGYSNPSHFSVAFRKQYGINPSELRNGVVKIPQRVDNDSQ